MKLFGYSRLYSYSSRGLLALFLIFSITACAQILLKDEKITRLAVKGDRLYMIGLLTGKTPKQVQNALRQHPEIKTIVLTLSPGGVDDDATYELGRLIREKGLNTHVIDRGILIGGAAELFLAGRERSMEQGARLAFAGWQDIRFRHAWQIPKDDSAHDPNVGFVRDMLGSEDFYWFYIGKTRDSDPYWLTQADIEQYGLLTKAVQPASGDPTPFGEEFEELYKEYQQEFAEELK